MKTYQCVSLWRKAKGIFQALIQRMSHLSLAAICGACLCCSTSTTFAAEEAANRPKIGLVLGGGGARGAAHIGVLKVLEELRIPIDYVVGTSMGSIVGGLYASGMSPEEIDREMRAMDWETMFDDAPVRTERTFRRKRDDDFYTVKVKPGFNDGELKLPLAYIRGQKLNLELSRLTSHVSAIRNFENLPIPYRAVAADVETGEEVVLKSGDLARSIRASMAVPGAFDPVELDNKLLVDGGIANNVPVNVARSMGADIVIVVNVGSGLLKRDEIKSAVEVGVQLTNFLFTLNTKNQLASLSSHDILISPDLGDIGGGSFDRVAEAVVIGEKAARDAALTLSRYSLGKDLYAMHVADRDIPDKQVPVINFVRIDNHSQISDQIIASRISIKPGEKMDDAIIKQDISRIYGLDIFQTVTYDIVEEDGKKGLLISAREKWWGPGYIQPGIEYSNQNGADSKFNFGLLYTRTQINALNGEWRIGLQMGDEPSVNTDIYQPLDPLNRSFLAGQVLYQSRYANTFDNQGNKLSRYTLRGYGVDLAAGINFDNSGELRLGYARQGGTAKLETGQPAPDFDYDIGYTYLRLAKDSMDSLYFPRKGQLARAEFQTSRKALGAQSDFDQILLAYNAAYSWGKNSLLGSMLINSTVNGTPNLEKQFQAGGFMNISGLQESELSGKHMALGRLVYMRSMQGGKLMPGYVGASLEAGNTWQRSEDISANNLIFASSLFVGFDSFIGPIYLGYGRADTGDSGVYLRLGPLIK
jgi:NTE family protein